MSSLPVEIGHAKKYCTNTCEECNYYKEIRNQIINVLIVTPSNKLPKNIKKESHCEHINVKFADSEYVCSMIISEFIPDFVVIDDAFGQDQCQKIADHLMQDPRIPTVNLIRATETTYSYEKGFAAHIHPSFTMLELSDLIESVIE